MKSKLTALAKYKKYIIAILIIIAIVFARTQLLKKPDTVLTHTVKKDTLVDMVQISGTYTTAAQTEVLSPTQGIITKLYVANSQDVKKGAPLFYVESSASDIDRTKAWAALKKSESDLNIAQNSYKDKQAIAEKIEDDVKGHEDDEDFATRATRTTAQVARDSAYDALQTAKAALASAQIEYAKTQSILIKAPAAGTVVNLQKTVGDQVDITLPVLLVANLGNPVISVSINENYIPRIKEGQKATIVFDALKDRTFSGSVKSVNTVGTNTNGVITYSTQILASDLPDSIRPNMTAVVSIETVRKENTLLVPNSALIEKDGKVYVKRADAKTNGLLEVKVITNGINQSEIQGIPEGTLIVANANSQE